MLQNHKKMKLATKYILIAIALEIFLAMITFCVLGGIHNFLEDFFAKFCYFLPPLIPILILIFALGQWINYSKMNVSFRKFLGVFYIFLFLYIYLIVSSFVGNYYFYVANPEWIWYNLEIMLVYTTIFGGLQTLGVGIWLGYKLSQIKN